jgi:hypothetical protein
MYFFIRFISKRNIGIYKKGIFSGLFFSFLVIFYDFDFFLNVGGPETKIIDSIGSVFGPISPLILFGIPVGIGLLVSYMIKNSKKEQVN